VSETQLFHAKAGVGLDDGDDDDYLFLEFMYVVLYWCGTVLIFISIVENIHISVNIQYDVYTLLKVFTPSFVLYSTTQRPWHKEILSFPKNKTSCLVKIGVMTTTCACVMLGMGAVNEDELCVIQYGTILYRTDLFMMMCAGC
jgi:hypothetical protein